ncbi:DUF6146 family protein [Flavobacterium sp.]|uniref:DUF6146 family protein n=1 Tax=Flavobacterium sp. TaxID=239 RepID=UPI003D1364C4
MKAIFFFLGFLSLTVSCQSQTFDASKNNEANAKVIKGDTIKIANEETEYEVIIIDPGYSSWLYSRALPRGYYSLSYLENKNQLWIQEWNNRVMQPQRFNPNLYEMQINYDRTLRYGYEVNYLIYNYLVYFQNANNQQLFGRVPPR